jgi:hypothetical protein
LAHAKPYHLKGLGVLLREIRATPALKEKAFGCFYLKSKGVLHFHIQQTRFFAHVFDGAQWNEVDIRLPLSDVKQRSLSQRILKFIPL